ncbi:SDR family NAD(P)-dependent oxidoreductase [Thauera linaloolentis]|uniref:Short chain dehydrogenase/reductase family oxidoreductase n=1 Tax=Thauera linaloolentis (strain DSM 12138 / JCM 21573 / CCUG 41526 / CIP 105981 / IAM 15112 / NBRC 102519 / 47Lol) TaxID=1123367 RepID=N6Z545_THAL4|nr:SDR family NAD(P)-dependent oxidoreductase [Thauera linaloolentis]ENO87274.1 short chain dehydrogenase/reductase family oxidoreductase [Thauera linaloolentis 47Lol = DSM 12138]MCM8566724.1 SDR family oxidoreductase [Thauera linaloolentis]
MSIHIEAGETLKRFSLEGRVALVTGAGSGLGERMAHVLAAAGARVVCAARRVERVEAVAEAIRAAGGKAMACRMDVGDKASIGAALDAVEARFGSPAHILVNNAGGTDPTAFHQMTEAQWTSLLDVNLSGPFYVTQAVAQRLIAAEQGGAIINIASILGHLAYPNFINYGTTKGALIHMTRYMALDLLPYGIRVNAIAPGYFPSEMTNPFYESEAGKKEIANLPAKRLGRLEELDGPLLLLASEASSFMNGSIVTVDYGHSIRLS